MMITIYQINDEGPEQNSFWLEASSKVTPLNCMLNILYEKELKRK